MSYTETLPKRDIINNSPITDTIQLPFDPHTYLHISTTPNKLAHSFATYGSLHNLDYAQSLDFVQNRTNFRFGAPPPIHFPGFTKADRLINDFFCVIRGEEPHGYIQPEFNTFIFGLNPKLIANNLDILDIYKFSSNEYAAMTSEEKKTCLERSIETALVHEYFHLIQWLTNREEQERSARRVIYSHRLVISYAISLFAAIKYLPTPQDTIYVYAATPVFFAALHYLNKSIKLSEEMTLNAHHEALNQTTISPFTYTYETYDET